MTRARICVIGAMDEEIAEFLSHAKMLNIVERRSFRFHEASLFGVPVVVVKCGVGKVFAALIAQTLIDTYQPAAVISTGVAGALSKSLRIGDVVVGRDSAHHDMDARALGFMRGHIPYTDFRFFTTDEKFSQLALAARLDGGHKIVHGRILSGDQFVSGDREATHGHLTGELSGDAVDMETAAIAQVCAVNETPFVSIRTISDHADGSAHIDFNTFLPVIASNSFHIIRKMLVGISEQ